MLQPAWRVLRVLQYFETHPPLPPLGASTATKTGLKALEPVQRLCASAMTGGFKSVSLVVAEAKAYILPMQARLLIQRARHWGGMHSTHEQNPLRRL